MVLPSIELPEAWLPATETSTRSHQDPRGTVSRPLTMVALSWASSQVTLSWDGMSTAACSANRPAESASPTYTARRPPATSHCWSAADQYWNWRRGTSTLTHRDSPGASVTRANCDSCRTANCTPAGAWLGAPRYSCGTAAPLAGPVLRTLKLTSRPPSDRLDAANPRHQHRVGGVEDDDGVGVGGGHRLHQLRVGRGQRLRRRDRGGCRPVRIRDRRGRAVVVEEHDRELLATGRRSCSQR